MVYSELVKKASLISFDAHKDDKDKGGYPYFMHPLHLAEQLDDEVTVCVALLHDVVEDHGDKYPMDYLAKEFPNEVIEALKLLTHKKEDNYLDYVKRIKTNSIAKKVKLADLKHNSNKERNDGDFPPKYELYKAAIDILEEANHSKEKEFCKKWLPMLERVDSDESLKERCKAYNAYIPSERDNKLELEFRFHMFLEEAYDSGIVIGSYSVIIEESEEIWKPTDGFIDKLSEIEIIASIAWHFRRDHFNEGSLINESIPDGSLLKLFKALLKEK